MVATAIGIFFIALGTLWALAAYMVGGMTEYRATWQDVPWQIVFSVPLVLVGIAIVLR